MAKRIQGLEDINDLEQVSPRKFWCDKGCAFMGVLMSNFKNYKAERGLIREAQKEQHQVTRVSGGIKPRNETEKLLDLQ